MVCPRDAAGDSLRSKGIVCDANRPNLGGTFVSPEWRGRLVLTFARHHEPPYCHPVVNIIYIVLYTIRHVRAGSQDQVSVFVTVFAPKRLHLPPSC